MTSIQEIMQVKHIQVPSNSPVKSAIDVMAKNHHGVIVTVDSNVPNGILTERDLVNLIKEEVNFDLPISLFSKKSLITVKKNRSIDYALHLLIENTIRRLVVVDDQGFFMGIVTQSDVIKHLEEDSYKANILVSQILEKSKPIITIPSSGDVRTAITQMNEKKIGSIIIVDKNETPIGIFTERDTISIINNNTDLETNICEVMSKPIIAVEHDTQVKDMIEYMSERNIRRVLVVNGIKIEGLISFRDIAQNLKGKYGQILESKLRNIKSTLNHIGESVLEIYEDNNEHIIQWANQKALKNFGNSILDTAIDTLLDKKDWLHIKNQMKKEGKCKTYDLQIGSLFFELVCSYHYIQDKETLLLILRDTTKFEAKISKEEQKRKELEKELELLQSVIDQQETLIVVGDIEDIIEVNKAFLEFFNVSDIKSFTEKFNTLQETFITHKDFYSVKNVNNWIEDIQTLPQYKKIVSIVDPKSIEPKAFTIQINPLDDQNRYFVITLTDITNIKLESQKHYYNATHDALTKIYNRSYFLDTITGLLYEAGRYTNDLSVILFDIDHFKSFNDTYGHLKGDEVLTLVAKTTAENIRKSDIIARWGGEEFIVLLPNTPLATAELVAENLRKQISTIKIFGVDRAITSSFGVTEFKEGDDHDIIVKRADDALYEAKKGGRDCVKSK
jgi:diguanylate cyclase (GGDEF)-like protein